MNLPTERTRGLLNICHLSIETWIIRVQEDGDQRSCRNQLVQEPKPLWLHLCNEKIYPRRVAARSIQTGYEAELDRVVTAVEYDRDCGGCRFGCERRGIASGCDNHSHLTTSQLGRERRQAIILALGPAIFDCDVLALDISEFLQPLLECGYRFGE